MRKISNGTLRSRRTYEEEFIDLVGKACANSRTEELNERLKCSIESGVTNHMCHSFYHKVMQI